MCHRASIHKHKLNIFGSDLCLKIQNLCVDDSEIFKKVIFKRWVEKLWDSVDNDALAMSVREMCDMFDDNM